jgi:hypothetical protein
MNLKEQYNNLINTEMYKEFIEHHPDYKLTNFFFVYENNNFSEKQIGFYSEEQDKIVSFDLIKHKSTEPEDAMKKSGTIPSFDVNDSKVEIKEALDIANQIVKDNYSQHKVTKYICILQIIDNVLTWNMTLITDTFNMINIRVNADSKEVISHNIQSIMSLAKE